MLVREFLLRHLPVELSVSKGFIRHLDKDVVSPEVDLLITDSRRHVPIFREGDFQIVPPSSVLATMEIKSTYRPDVLQAALSNVRKVREVALSRRPNADLWSAVIFISATSQLTATTISRDIATILKDPGFWEDSEVTEHECRAPLLTPQIVCVIDSCIAFLEPNDGGGVTVKAFTADRLSAALAFAQLFGYLRASLTDRHDPGELDFALERCEGLASSHAEVPLPSK